MATSVSPARHAALLAVLRGQVYCDETGKQHRPANVNPTSLTAAFTVGLCRWAGFRYDDLLGHNIDTAELTDIGRRAVGL